MKTNHTKEWQHRIYSINLKPLKTCCFDENKNVSYVAIVRYRPRQQ